MGVFEPIKTVMQLQEMIEKDDSNVVV